MQVAATAASKARLDAEDAAATRAAAAKEAAAEARTAAARLSMKEAAHSGEAKLVTQVQLGW